MEKVITTKERPILFSGPMVRAILDGRKTITRRIVKSQDCVEIGTDGNASFVHAPDCGSYCDYACAASGETLAGHIGWTPWGSNPRNWGHLWVRETFLLLWPEHYHAQGARELVTYRNRLPVVNGVEYRADCSNDDESDRCRIELGYTKWKSSIFMPRWASRISLALVSVTVERLHDITDEDAAKEGFESGRDKAGHSPRDQFALLWDTINGRGSWHANPWVWRVEFKRVTE